MVSSTLGRTSSGKRYVVNDLVVADEYGNTSQIDHIYINKNGIFVIETKNYSGKIYGNDKREKWTQVLGYGAQKNEFFSPVKQNEKHILRLRKKLGEKAPLINIVVFTKADLFDVDSSCTFRIDQLKGVLNFSYGIHLTVAQMEEYYSILLNLKEIAPANDEHVKRVKQQQKQIAKGKCPCCGAELVLRTSKNGNKFLGCSSYPKCKFTKRI